jgi:hypothetical protein
LIHEQLLLGPFDHSLFNGATTDQTIDLGEEQAIVSATQTVTCQREYKNDETYVHRLFLSNPMNTWEKEEAMCQKNKVKLISMNERTTKLTCSGLDIGAGIPVTIKKDASVGRLKVEPHASTSCRQEKHKVITLWRIELVDNIVPLGTGRRAIKAAVLPPTHRAVIVKDIQSGRKLRVEYHAMFLLVETAQQHVKDGQLSRSGNQVFTGRTVHVDLGSVKQKGMKTTLSKLHDEIVQYLHFGNCRTGWSVIVTACQQINILEQQRLVPKYLRV